MIAAEAISLACVLRPNELGEEALSLLLLELDSRLAAEVRGERVPKRETPVYRSELTIPAPFDRLYWIYLVAMIDMAAGDNEAYSVSYALFTEARDAYARWYQRTGGRA